MRPVDDVRIGRVCRALRRRKGWRQVDLALRAGCHQTTISGIELGRASSLSVARLRSIFAALDARYEGLVLWRGGELDRLLDERHAALVDAATATFARAGWVVLPEVSFSVFGERGSIDLLAAHAATRTAAVCEMKTQIGSVEETLRRHDAKVRLAPGILRERLGWRPLRVVRLLVMPEAATLRRTVDRHRNSFDSVYPGTSRAVRALVARPGWEPGGPTPLGGAGSLLAGGIWFLSLKSAALGARKPVGRSRVRRPRSDPTPGASRTGGASASASTGSGGRPGRGSPG